MISDDSGLILIPMFSPKKRMKLGLTRQSREKSCSASAKTNSRPSKMYMESVYVTVLYVILHAKKNFKKKCHLQRLISAADLFLIHFNTVYKFGMCCVLRYFRSWDVLGVLSSNSFGLCHLGIASAVSAVSVRAFASHWDTAASGNRRIASESLNRDGPHVEF